MSVSIGVGSCVDVANSRPIAANVFDPNKEFAYVTSNPQTYLEVKHERWSEERKSKVISGASASFTGDCFSGNATFDLTKVQNNKSSFEDFRVHIVKQVATQSIKPPTILQSCLENGFASMIQQLPKEYKYTDFEDIFTIFGTHFIANCSLGGVFAAYSKTSEDTSYSETKQKVTAAATYFAKLKASSDSTVSNETKRLLESVSVSAIGGTFAPTGLLNVDSSTLASWLQSVDANHRPSLNLVEYNLKPLSYLLPDSEMKANMEKATNEYLEKHGVQTIPPKIIKKIQLEAAIDGKDWFVVSYPSSLSWQHVHYQEANSCKLIFTFFDGTTKEVTYWRPWADRKFNLYKELHARIPISTPTIKGNIPNGGYNLGGRIFDYPGHSETDYVSKVLLDDTFPSGRRMYQVEFQWANDASDSLALM